MPCHCVIVMFTHFQPIFNDSFDSTKGPKEDDGNVENSLPSAAGINLTTRRGQLRDGPMVSLGWKHRRNTSEKQTLKIVETYLLELFNFAGECSANRKCWIKIAHVVHPTPCDSTKFTSYGLALLEHNQHDSDTNAKQLIWWHMVTYKTCDTSQESECRSGSGVEVDQGIRTIWIRKMSMNPIVLICLGGAHPEYGVQRWLTSLDWLIISFVAPRGSLQWHTKCKP